MRSSALLVALIVSGIVVWLVNLDGSRSPAWYDCASWLFGMAAAVYAAGRLIAYPLNRIAKISLWAGIGVGVFLWLALSPPLGGHYLVAVLSLVVGALLAFGVDMGYRLLWHGEGGPWRFVRPDGGGRVAAVPAWAVALIAILGGLALIYWKT